MNEHGTIQMVMGGVGLEVEVFAVMDDRNEALRVAAAIRATGVDADAVDVVIRSRAEDVLLNRRSRQYDTPTALRALRLAMLTNLANTIRAAAEKALSFGPPEPTTEIVMVDGELCPVGVSSYADWHMQVHGSKTKAEAEKAIRSAYTMIPLAEEA